MNESGRNAKLALCKGSCVEMNGALVLFQPLSDLPYSGHILKNKQ